jgi:hypothetical protein
MNKICEGNLYNIESEISHTPEPTISGLDTWKEQVKKDLIEKIKQGSIKDIHPILLKVFGQTLE